MGEDEDEDDVVVEVEVVPRVQPTAAVASRAGRDITTTYEW